MGPSQKFNRELFDLPRFGGLREGRKTFEHWWVKNAGFKLVVGKINFRAKKIGTKVDWWVRNFCPLTEWTSLNYLGTVSQRDSLGTNTHRPWVFTSHHPSPRDDVSLDTV